MQTSLWLTRAASGNYLRVIAEETFGDFEAEKIWGKAA